jgi:hypothetical protein
VVLVKWAVKYSLGDGTQHMFMLWPDTHNDSAVRSTGHVS